MLYHLPVPHLDGQWGRPEIGEDELQVRNLYVGLVKMVRDRSMDIVRYPCKGGEGGGGDTYVSAV